MNLKYCKIDDEVPAPKTWSRNVKFLGCSDEQARRLAKTGFAVRWPNCRKTKMNCQTDPTHKKTPDKMRNSRPPHSRSASQTLQTGDDDQDFWPETPLPWDFTKRQQRGFLHMLRKYQKRTRHHPKGVLIRTERRFEWAPTKPKVAMYFSKARRCISLHSEKHTSALGIIVCSSHSPIVHHRGFSSIVECLGFSMLSISLAL